MPSRVFGGCRAFGLYRGVYGDMGIWERYREERGKNRVVYIVC